LPGADHVIVWVISSLRADRIDATSPRTPALSAFAGRAVWFDVTTTATASGPAHVALITGRRTSSDTVPATTRTLGERFRDAGFTTALISGNGVVSDDRGFARGFDHYENPMRQHRPHGARTLWQSARRILAERAADHVFLLIATSEPHLPYTPSADALLAEWPADLPRPASIDPARTADIASATQSGKRALTGEEQRYVRSLYDAEVRDADAAFAEMLADLEKLEIADRTAIVVIGDVGQELFERGAFGHGHQIHRETVMVPVAFRAPGLSPARSTTIRPSMVDVYPTVLALGGIAATPAIHGENVIPWARGAMGDRPHVAISHLPGRARSIEIASHRLVVSARGGVALYDVVADPAERRDLASSRPIAVRALRNVLGIATAYEEVWSRSRWGGEASVTEAFASDQGL
jgi:arylsulfatase A-like enzyme